LGIVAHACYTSTGEAVVELQSKFKVSLDYIARPCLRKTTKEVYGYDF
jgi:hypothetical protein